MINGNAKEFIEGLYYGDERFFCFEGNKYFIQGYYIEGKPMLKLYILEPADSNFEWHIISKNESYPVSEFENTPIFNGKTFWQVEQEIEWVDC